MPRVRVHNFTISLYGLDLPALGYECTSHVPTASATHIVLTRRA
jgi:hypothetical protein